MIDLISEKNWPSISSIYEEGITTGNATFEQTVPSWEKWISNKIRACSIYLTSEKEIIGWGALSKISDREVYSGVAEVSVYIKKEFCKKGYGFQILEKIIELSEENNIWTLQAGIFPENVASINLHKKCGFRLIGRREKIGKMNDQWRDTVLMERRSELL